jgi:hypothetical protein
MEKLQQLLNSKKLKDGGVAKLPAIKPTFEAGIPSSSRSIKILGWIGA